MGTMFIDHAAVAVIYRHGLNDMSPLLEMIGLAMRLVGRVAFPLYAFLLVQGFLWTRDRKKYASRILLFALAAEIPFDLASKGTLWYPYAQNTIMTLLVGLLCLNMLNVLEERYKLTFFGNLGSGSGISRGKLSPGRDVSSVFLGYVLSTWVIVISMFLVTMFRSDHGATGLFLIILFYIFRHQPAEQVAAGMFGLILIHGFTMNVFFGWIAFFFISRYNGERGRRMGYLPYVFYPAHLLFVWIAGEWIANWVAAGI